MGLVFKGSRDSNPMLMFWLGHQERWLLMIEASNFGLEGEIVSASAKILKCDSLTQVKARNVVSN